MPEREGKLDSTRRKGPSEAILLENTPVGPAPARSKAATCCFRKSLLRCRWLSGLLRNWIRRSSRITLWAASAAAALPAAITDVAVGRNVRLVIEPAWYQTCPRRAEAILAVSRQSEKFLIGQSRKFLLTAVRLKDGTNRDEPTGTG